MENNLKRYYLFVFLLSLTVYLLGTTLYPLFFGGDRYSELVGLALGGIVLAALLVNQKRNEKLQQSVRSRNQDERIAMFRGKAAYFTVGVTLLILFCAFIISILIDLHILAYFTSGLYVIIMSMMIAAHRHWNRII